VLNADGAIGQVAASRAIQLGLAALETTASVFVAVQACGHLGALGIFALAAAEAGAFCMIAQRTPPDLAVPGFSGPAIGDNPIAFGCPCAGLDPIVFDMACSVVAGGHIRIAALEGRTIPGDWALDETGRSTTDPTRALHGALLAVGGYKGLGIAMMVECLAGAMAANAASLSLGRNVIPEGGAPGRQSAFLWMIKPAAFSLKEHFNEYMTQWIDFYLSAGAGRARIPGWQSAQAERKAFAEGIEVSQSTEKELIQLGSQIRVPFGQR
jgi:LDH2 family malate/lactate/ureidoglycolate dehydrogenase